MQNEDKLFNQLRNSNMSILEIEDALKCIDIEIEYKLTKIGIPKDSEAEVL